jgi:hypothetical protein
MLSRKVRLLRAVLRNPQHVRVRRERNPCLAVVGGGLQIPERGGGREEKRRIVRGLEFRPEESERDREKEFLLIETTLSTTSSWEQGFGIPAPTADILTPGTTSALRSSLAWGTEKLF